MIYKLKRDLNDHITRYKIKCVVKNFMQQTKIDYHETFASIVKIMFFKALFVIVVKLNLDCEQIDIKTIFLNSILQKKVYAASFENYEDSKYIGLLKRVLYDLKQSFKKGYTTLKNGLKKQEFQHINVDHSVFINKKKQLILIIYVNDLLIIKPLNNSVIIQLKENLNNRFKMIDMRPCYHYLKMMIIRNRVNKTLTLFQRAYVKKMLNRFEMKNCKFFFISMIVKIQLIPKIGHQTIIFEITKYQSIINSLMYAMIETRFDIVYCHDFQQIQF